MLVSLNRMDITDRDIVYPLMIIGTEIRYWRDRLQQPGVKT